MARAAWSERWGRWPIVVGVLLTALYLASAVLYARSLSAAAGDYRPPVADDAVEVFVLPRGLDAAGATLTALVYVLPPDDLFDEDGRLVSDLVVWLYPVLGADALEFSAGSRLAPAEKAIPVFGKVQDYPFDSYSIDVSAEAQVGHGGTARLVPVVTSSSAELVGWHSAVGPVRSVRVSETETEALPALASAVSFTFKRAGSTMAISLLILGLMVALAALALSVSWSVGTGRRKIEATMAGWFGAMLFALVPLRTFLPGAPPLGSWIDILLFFWVEIALMLALGSFIASWLRRGPRPQPAAVSDGVPPTA